ncbi:glycosyltransferase family 2 protein [Xenophilus azovorans]|uniref:glycosyltransferase family 2 protein n=1 Tax=Xenophilus azovorans TaxID=151755 RepID=UPI0005701359|nr:glycosyltransferase family 2 protein [Xenophilus azovorans]
MTAAAPDLAALRIAAVIPCYNEAAAIGQVIASFRAALPQVQIHVFDNASTDDTAAVARAAGAEVTHVALRGKGNVVRRMFADVEADVYVMVDGDATYDLARLAEMIALLVDGNLDMVVGARQDDRQDVQTYRPGHRLGNRLLTGTVAALFGGGFTDMLSGLRVFSRRYVKSFPALAQGFETETELTVHALELRMPWTELPVRYLSRPEGSDSKLSTYRDGWRILLMITRLFVNERPLSFFSTIAALLALAALALAVPLVLTWLHTGLVPRLPTAVLATGMMLAGMLSAACGAVLRTVTLGRREVKRLRYLAIPGVRYVLERE